MRSLRPTPDTTPRAVLYLRQSVSRDDSISIELQEMAGRNYCALQGYEVTAVEVDEGLSGRNWSKRPAVQRVMDLIEAKHADVIVLWKWSRLSRSRTDWALAADRIDVAGGRIESATEPIDTATASGRFARGVMTEYAAFQSEQISEQWSEVHARRIGLGLPATGVIPWGWTLDRDRLTIPEDKAETIRAMYGMYFEGRGLVYIANWLNDRGYRTKRNNLWQFAAVRGFLNSPIHAGYVTHGGILYPGAHDGVITEAEYARFRTMRTARYVPKRARTSPYLLSTIVVCHCGRKRVGNISQKRSRSYACTATERHKKKYRICSAIDSLVNDWVEQLDVKTLRDAGGAPINTELVRAEIERLETGLTNLNVNLAMERITPDEHRAARQAMTSEINELSEQVQAAESAYANSAGMYLAGKETLPESWPLLSVQERQPLLRSIVNFVKIMPDDSIEIHTQWGEIVHKSTS